MERTLVIIKPDAVQRGLIGDITQRLERRGLRMIGMKFMAVPRALAEQHYAVHKERPFYNGLIEYITSSPVVVQAWAGKKAVAAVRQVMGKTNPLEAEMGTVRADYGLEIGRNLTHGSDSPENGEAEVALWFDASELVDWVRVGEDWIYE